MGIWFLRTEVGDHLDVCGSKITVEYDVSTPTADLSTAKILINSTLSTPNRHRAAISSCMERVMF